MTMANAFALSSLYAATLSSPAASLSLLPSCFNQQGSYEVAGYNQADALLQALPAAVILLDQRGYVYQANAAAIDLLGEPLIG
jgi:PAS domain-containing protein